MVDIIKQDMTNIWAVAGDVVAPDVAKIRGGWGVEAVPRQWWNWFENRQDTNIAYMLQKGIPEWDQFTEYLTNKSYVQRNNIVYKCILTGTNKDPATTPANWVKAFPESSAYLETIRPLAVSNNSMAFIDGSGAAQNTPSTAFGRSGLNVADAAAARTLYAAQQANSNLSALSAVTAATNALPYFTGTTSMGTTILTQAGRDILAGVDYAAIRATLGLTSAAITSLMANNLENDVSKIMRVGAFGLGSFADLRAHIYATGVPSDCFGIGTVFGFVNGGSSPVGGLAIPGLTGTFYGTLQVNGQYSDASGLSGMSRVFITTNGRTFTQTAASAGAWGPWVESWTTSNLVRTTSNTDTTAGRIVQTGNYGLGNSIPLADNADLDTVIVSGNYRLANHPGLPSAASYGQLMVIRGQDTIVQIAFGYQNRTFSRSGNPAVVGGAGNWGNWIEYYNTGNTAQIVADVTAGIQTVLDGKLDKSGGTMTGSLTVPSLEVGRPGANGYIDIHQNGGNGDFDVRLYSDNAVPGTSGAGRFGVNAAGGMYINGIIYNNGINTTGAINASGGIQGVGVVSTAGLTVTAGATALQGVSAVSLSTTQGIAATGSITAGGGFSNMGGGFMGVRCVDSGNTGNTHYYMYDYNGSERALMYADSGGTIHFRTRSQGDTLALNANRTAQFYSTVSVAGRVNCTDIVAATNVFSGNGGAYLAGDGNVYGGAWGGWISNWVSNNFVGNLGVYAAIAASSAGQVGSYALLQHPGGSSFGAGTLVDGTQLSWATCAGGFNERVNYGTWRCMGRVNTGNLPVATTVFLRAA
ncbi:putative tail fiber protein [Pseudomonas phage UAVern]|uniref:Tail fiber protein n=1 Tax=Pseudomonas phage UAVern TaxID=2856997 RepID=A0A975UX18_9CAUD|nr:putative tail fiber protein [Pseudomonas phage UAVern]